MKEGLLHSRLKEAFKAAIDEMEADRESIPFIFRFDGTYELNEEKIRMKELQNRFFFFFISFFFI